MVSASPPKGERQSGQPESLGVRAERARIGAARIKLSAASSVVSYFANTTIDSDPEPRRWCELWEPWQATLIRPLAPALEDIAGVRTGYTGPRNFWFTLPRGHDKTSFIARCCNWLCRYSRRPLMGAAAASTRDQASLLFKSMEAERRLNPWFGDSLETFRRSVKGPGGEVEVLSSDAGAASGRKDDFQICDEITYWENRDLYDVLRSGAFKRPRSIFVVITNAGIRGTWQWDLLQQAKASSGWHVYESPLRRMMASWMTPEKVEQVRKELAPGFARRVIDNEWIDQTERPAIERAEIEQCYGDCLWSRPGVSAGGGSGLHYIGVDFGRTRNKTVIWVVEKQITQSGARYPTRSIRVLDGVPFAEQERIIRQMITPQTAGVYLDKGAQGWTTCENLEKSFPRVCFGHFLTGNFRAEIALRFIETFKERTIVVPKSEQMTLDLMRVQQVETANGKPRLQVDESAEGFHADYFWAGALAVAAARASRDFVAVAPRPLGGSAARTAGSQATPAKRGR